MIDGLRRFRLIKFILSLEEEKLLQYFWVKNTQYFVLVEKLVLIVLVILLEQLVLNNVQYHFYPILPQKY
jgi:hypothetical protein